MSRPAISLCALLAAFSVLPLSIGLAADPSGRASVIDADTIELRGQRIRLHGIDAPESAQTCQRDGKEWHCGQAAALALSDWLGATTITCRQTDTDRYKRIVAKCSKAGLDVGQWLVVQGWALDWPRYSGGAYAAAQAKAEAAKAGMWGSKFQPPWEWRHTSSSGGGKQ